MKDPTGFYMQFCVISGFDFQHNPRNSDTSDPYTVSVSEFISLRRFTFF